MINVETIRFLNMLNELANLSAAGIKDFSNATQDNIHSMVFFDSESTDEEGFFRVVLDSCIVDDPEYLHHDIVSYYDSDTSEFTVRVIVEDDEPPYIQVKLLISNEIIVIENGRWYFAN